jgi:hypothetical protein
MDLCGNVTRDTVVVNVAPAGVTPLTPKGEPAIWPNPVHDVLTVSNAAGEVLCLYDMVGEEVFTTVIQSDKEVENIQSLVPGVYLVEVLNSQTGERTTKKVVKE